MRVHLEILVTEQRPEVVHFGKREAFRVRVVEDAEAVARSSGVEEDVALGTFLFAYRLEGRDKVSVRHAAHVHFLVGLLPDGQLPVHDVSKCVAHIPRSCFFLLPVRVNIRGTLVSGRVDFHGRATCIERGAADHPCPFSLHQDNHAEQVSQFGEELLDRPVRHAAREVERAARIGDEHLPHPALVQGVVLRGEGVAQSPEDTFHDDAEIRLRRKHQVVAQVQARRVSIIGHGVGRVFEKVRIKVRLVPFEDEAVRPRIIPPNSVTAGIVPPKGILMLVRPGRIRVRPNRKADAVGFLYRAMEQPVCLLNGKRGGHQHAHRTHVRLFLVWVVFVPQVAVSASQVEVVDILFAVLAQRVEIKGRVASEQLHLHFVLRDIGHDGCAFQGQQLRDQAKREFLACKEFQRHGAVLQRTEDL